MPLTPEGKRLFGNERQRIQAVKGSPIHVRTRLEPVLSRSDVYDSTASLKNDFDSLEKTFHNKLNQINSSYKRNQDRWPLYLVLFEDFRFKLAEIIKLIRQKL